MSLRTVRASLAAERADVLHEARLLLLLRSESCRRGCEIDGITKLAKMDFLLRYPVYLERVLQRTRKKPPAVEMQPYERDTVESRMIRFRYGPWDPRYRRWIGILVAKGLAGTRVEGRTVYVRLTDRGSAAASQLAGAKDLQDFGLRCDVISKCVGGMSGSRLKDLIYEVVPELTGLQWGEEIPT